MINIQLLCFETNITRAHNSTAHISIQRSQVIVQCSQLMSETHGFVRPAIIWRWCVSYPAKINTHVVTSVSPTFTLQPCAQQPYKLSTSALANKIAEKVVTLGDINVISNHKIFFLSPHIRSEINSNCLYMHPTGINFMWTKVLATLENRVIYALDIQQVL